LDSVTDHAGAQLGTGGPQCPNKGRAASLLRRGSRQHTLELRLGTSLIRFFLPKFRHSLLPYGARGILATLGLPPGESRLRRCILILTACLPMFLAQAGLSESAEANGFDSLLHQGFDLHQRNDYSHALPLLRRAWQIRPHDYFVNLLIGIDLLRTGKGADALSFLREAARVGPQEEFPCEYLGEAEAGLRHYAAASEAYACAMRVAPQSAQAAVAFVDFSLARFGEMAGRLRSSRRGLAAEYRLQALAHAVADPERLLLMERAAELDDTAPGIWGELALAQSAVGRMDEAKASLGKSRQQGTDDVRAWEAESLLAAQNGDWTLAVKRLNEIGDRSPALLARAVDDWPVTVQAPPNVKVAGVAAAFLDCVAAHCGPEGLRRKIAEPSAAGVLPASETGGERLSSRASATKASGFRGAIALAESDEFDHAIPALERALSQLSQGEPHGPPKGNASQAGARDAQLREAQDNSRIYAMFLLSWCYAQRASAVAQRLQQTGEDEAQIHIMRGDILLRLQANGSGALSEYQAALNKRGNDPEILQRLAEAQLSAGQTADAADSAERAMKLDPHRLPAMRTLAKIAMEKRDYDGALQYLRPLAAADPADLTTRVQLGTACAQTGALNEALQNLSPALRDGYPDEKGSLHYLLGTVLRKLGRASEAASAFAAARELSDNFQRTPHHDEAESQTRP